MLLLVLTLAVAILCVVYIRSNDAKLDRLPPEALAISPKRWTTEDINTCHASLKDGPSSLFEGKLPPKTGRRYIVIGGAGFLGGWVVLHLVQRGEDPRRIRVLDVRLPTRTDLQKDKARDVDFLKVDITDRKAVNDAFDKPWPNIDTESSGPEPEVTVFHTAATIRFYERHSDLLHLSERVNVHGTQNVLDAARRIGVRTFVYTSSGSVAVRRSRFWLWPWETAPAYFTQVIDDDDRRLPTRHDEFFSNYAESKLTAERRVRAADRSQSGDGVMRTGCLRPGNGIYGPGGDLLVGAYLIKKWNPSWVGNIMQSFIFVENCSYAHLLYEQRLMELERGVAGVSPEIGGSAFCVADAGVPPTFGDIHQALKVLSNGETKFPHFSITAMLGLAHLVEIYYLIRHFLLGSPYSFLGRLMPRLLGEVVFLQPSMFALTQVHLYFDDSRARAPPEKGGLGYDGFCTSIQGVCQVVVDHYRTGGKGTVRIVAEHVDANQSPVTGAEYAVGAMANKIADGLDATKTLN
ncbi:hypothetical protein EIP86_008852 [Pleurotus ostreatoroseus]|nr:hypothetical protein EIP86_008852 [Pleurotus ostreatoroseus]